MAASTAISIPRTIWSRKRASAPWRAPPRIGRKSRRTRATKPYAALLEHYLSPRHRDDPGHGCAFAALGNDAARCGKTVRGAFAEGLEPLLDILAEARPGPLEGRAAPQGRRRHGRAGRRLDRWRARSTIRRCPTKFSTRCAASCWLPADLIAALQAAMLLP